MAGKRDGDGEQPAPVSSWDISCEDLIALNESKSVGEITKVGGLEGLAKALKTDLKSGLSQHELDHGSDARMEEFGRNVFPEPPSKTIAELFIEALKDTTLIILMVAAVVSLLLGILVEKDTEKGWIDGVAILGAVLLVSCVTAFNDYSKEKQFRKLNAVKEDKNVKVLRDGNQLQLSIHDLLAGDVCVLESGDAVPADGIFMNGQHFEIDESVMTGESMTVKKSKQAPFMLSGCQVTEGFGMMLVTGIGVNSEWGMTLAKLVESREDTPLQVKLDHMAELIGKIGLGMAILTFIALVIRWTIRKVVDDEAFEKEDVSEFVDFFILAVTIVVVAVPEGLPLAVTISLAYSMRKMMDDNNLVRHLEACETMGGATNICSDKTGTLTENKMTVTQGWFGGKTFNKLPLPQELPDNLVKYIGEGVAVNSKAFVTTNEETGLPVFVGNKTECALLMMGKKWGQEYKDWRAEATIANVYPFNAERKRMSTMTDYSNVNTAAAHVPEVTTDVKYRLHVKGASEIVLRMCAHYINEEGERVEMSNEIRETIKANILHMAEQSLRTIVVAHRDFASDGGAEWEEPTSVECDLTFDGLCGIKDPLRPEVPDAVIQCQEAGIFVRMVTGDNLITAKTIARECGILREGDLALEGPVFRQMADEEVDKILPRLSVLARSSPTDKFRLVNRLKKKGEVVAVTGDGTNDAAALKEADVGLSMGLSGTEVAKEASDIVILDDNFTSIVRAVLWGRSVYDNIRKFLQFQLTVNLVALTVAFIGAVTKAESPLKTVQLLWINLIMDTLAALALATEGPTPDMLRRKPYGRFESLISPTMVRNMLTQSTYQLVVCFFLLYNGARIFDIVDDGDSEKFTRHVNTVVFNAFVYCQVFNEINSRKVNDETNVFANISKSYLFLFIFGATFVVQYFICQFGGDAMETEPLSVTEFVVTMLIGAMCLPFGFVFRMIPPICYKDTNSPAYKEAQAKKLAELESAVQAK